MKFKFGEVVEVVKGKFHKGSVGTVVGFFVEEETDKVRYVVALRHDTQIHAASSWLRKMNSK